ncbi:MAG: CBS domain-containing protein, partial [Bacteroidia bacterium]
IKNDISQMPVTSHERIVGCITENNIYESLVKDPEVKTKPVSAIMQEALPFVDATAPIDSISKMLNGHNSAVMVKDFKENKNYIITKHDVMKAFAV